MSTIHVPSEASQLAILESDASLHDKAIACHRLVYVAGPASVAPLAALLDHPQLCDYARSGLEAIGDPSASTALLAALPQLKGRRLAGVVNSLGVRREPRAVAVLDKLAADPASGVAAEALASLGRIASPEAAEILRRAVSAGPDKLRTAAGHSALVAAETLTREGQPAAAKALLAALLAAFPAGPIHDAALTLSSGSRSSGRSR